MTKLDLTAIQARVDAATAGPCSVWDDHSGSLERWVTDDADGMLQISFGYLGNRTQTDAEFVAHAYTDVPALLAEVARLRKLVDTLSKSVRILENEARYGAEA